MARIRTVKPELFKHEELYEAETDTGLPLRLSFIGLFTCCDREGRFKWRPRTLKVDILPYDNCDFSRVLDALATRGFVGKYESDGVEFGYIPSFSRHQVINNRESASELPDPSCCKACDASSTREPRDGHAGKEERKGKEKKGREGKEICTSDDALSVFQHWQTVMGKPRTVLDSKRKALITSRLRDGYTVQDLQAAATGCSLSPFHMGLNEQGRRYNGVDLIYRDAGKVDQFMEFSHTPPKPMTPADMRSAANQKQLDDWASDVGDAIEGDFEHA